VAISMSRCLPTLFASALVLCALGFGTKAKSQELSAQERQQASLAVARTVLGILSFVRWPEQPKELTLCVTGETQFAEALSGDLHRANGEILHVKRYAQNSEPSPSLHADIPPLGCNVLYLGQLSVSMQHRLFERFLHQPVLLISEADADCVVGYMFCLNVGSKRVSFNINLDSLARSSLRVHPNVLKLAQGKP